MNISDDLFLETTHIIQNIFSIFIMSSVCRIVKFHIIQYTDTMFLEALHIQIDLTDKMPNHYSRQKAEHMFMFFPYWKRLYIIIITVLLLTSQYREQNVSFFF